MLKGKNIVIMGVANKWSIAWGIAKVCKKQGANLIFTYHNIKHKSSIKKLLLQSGWDEAPVIFCDVTDDNSIKEAFKKIGTHLKSVHGLVHSIAHARKEELRGMYLKTSREGYALAQDVSAYSLVAITREASLYMDEEASVVTLSYLGAEKVVPNYNVMGVAKAALEASVAYLAHDLGPRMIRVNGISAGPIKTLAAKGVGDFEKIGMKFIEKAPLRRLVTAEDVGGVASFFLSDLSKAVTGEILHVDCGFNLLTAL